MNHDPVCGKRINRNKAHIEIEYKHRVFLLCCATCQAEFEKNPEKYIRATKPHRRTRSFLN